MNTPVLLRRFGSWAALALLLGGLAACDNDEGPDDEPEIDAIRLVIGNVTVNSTGGNPPATATVIPVGTHNVTLTALTAGGNVIALDPSEFQLRIEPVSGVAMPFTRTGSFAGTLAATTAGQGVVRVQIFHLIENHEDYEIAQLPITVQ